MNPYAQIPPEAVGSAASMALAKVCCLFVFVPAIFHSADGGVEPHSSAHLAHDLRVVQCHNSWVVGCVTIISAYDVTPSKDAAVQGLVLLKNSRVADVPALPLRRHKITAVLGPLANSTLHLMNRYAITLRRVPTDSVRLRILYVNVLVLTSCFVSMVLVRSLRGLRHRF
jgi:hypothetical protein